MGKKDAAVDAYIADASRWAGETKQLRRVLLSCGLTEALKWRKPCYSHGGGNVAIIQGFKPHCALMFFKGALLKDPEGQLVRQGENSQAAMRMEFTSVAEVKQREDALRGFIVQAIAVQDAGLQVEFKQRHELTLPEELQARLDAQPALARAFDSLTPGRRRGYVLHISGAKQSATRASRVERQVARILAGKGLNDR